jgi:maltose O-acetyltransferase
MTESISTKKRTDRPEDRAEITAKMGAFEKASTGEWYCFVKEPDLRAITDASWKRTAEINELAKKDRQAALRELKQFCPHIDESADIVFPLVLDYPTQLVVGASTFINMGMLHLSSGKLTIGKNCFIGPNAHFYTPNHCIDDLELRREGWQYDAPITLGDDVWFGGDVTVVPGVTIGSNVVVGAGSVVTKDVPSNCVVAGNPARVVKQI